MEAKCDLEKSIPVARRIALDGLKSEMSVVHRLAKSTRTIAVKSLSQN